MQASGSLKKLADAKVFILDATHTIGRKEGSAQCEQYTITIIKPNGQLEVVALGYLRQNVPDNLYAFFEAIGARMRAAGLTWKPEGVFADEDETGAPCCECPSVLWRLSMCPSDFHDLPLQNDRRCTGTLVSTRGCAAGISRGALT